MKFLILIQSNPSVADLFSAMSDDDRAAAFQQYFDIERDLTDAGELIESKAADESGQQAITRTEDGYSAAPVAAGTDVVSGFYLVDVSGPERAYEIAARFPEAAVGAVRVARTLTQEDFDAMGM